MKNILIVITKGEWGGAQVFVSTLAKILHRQGHQVTVACGEGDYLRDTLAPLGIPVIRFRWLKRTKNPFANILFGWEMHKFLATHDFDVIHFNSSNALLGVIGARLMRKRPKIVFTIHGLSVVDPNYKATAIAKWGYRILFKYLLSLVDAPVFVSKLNIDYAKKIGLLKRGTVIHNGIDTDTLQFMPRDEARAAFLKTIQKDISDRYLIGSIGRLAYPKNYEFLINIFPEILKEIPNATAVIIGEGPERARYEEIIKKNKLTNTIYLIGELADARKYIKAFDLFVLPSEFEGMSMTLIEAMFAEVPILASRVGGTPELLNNPIQTYELNDAEDFIDKLKAIRSKKETPYSEEQKAHRAQFDGEAMTKQYLKIYEETRSS